MTLVIYKEHRIEIKREKDVTSYSIWDGDGYMVDCNSVQLPVKAVMKDCMAVVDEYIENPDAF